MLQNVDQVTLIVTIVIAILGWIIALILQGWNARQEHRIKVRYDIYNQLVSQYKLVQESVIELSSSATSPLILMSTSLIPFQLGLKREYEKGVWFLYSEMECLNEGEQQWTVFVSSLMDKYFDYVKRYLGYVSILENWSAALVPLLPTQNILQKEMSILNEQIINDLKTLQGYSLAHGHDWRSWKEVDIKLILEHINTNASTAGMYLSDFRTLVHNQLLSDYFGYTKPIRKTLDEKFMVLTKNGLEVRLEKNHIQLLKELESGISPNK